MISEYETLVVMFGGFMAPKLDEACRLAAR